MHENRRKKRKSSQEYDKQVYANANKKSGQNNIPYAEPKFPLRSDVGKLYSVSVALPGSIIENAQSTELKTYLAGQLARAFAIYNVDEVVIFNEAGVPRNQNNVQTESNTKKRGDDNISSDPNVFFARILQYLETPQFLRKDLFPVHQDLKYAGLLNPLDCPHHVRQDEKSQFREGVVVDKKPKSGEGSLVNAGLTKLVIIDRPIKPGIRVTLDMGNYKTDGQHIRAKVVSPKIPRQNGLYWGYQVRIADSISKVFTECQYPGGYDVTIGTSERGKVVEDAISELPEFSHLLIVFGGLGGLETSIDADQDLKCTGEEADALFDLWINTCPGQGSRTIRTEEAVLITMASLRAAVNEKGRKKQ
ncbi:1951_t:CDS:10 [Acaulospora morrowiae]|uniref:1951_t:CDS:1 n=1 Tax=Acaulospora morrowiae TaxID=94023 RepID=A0A9N9FBI1_9GLOM|nr:1951_t:CDS:10 [Acaulospora morrowiae]